MTISEYRKTNDYAFIHNMLGDSDIILTNYLAISYPHPPPVSHPHPHPHWGLALTLNLVLAFLD